MTRTAALAALSAALFAASSARAQEYLVERVAFGLNQPTFVTQAPGDPGALYITERATFGAGSQPGLMGKLLRYDLATRQSTVVVDFSYRGLNLDSGLLAAAVHPDFAVEGSAGYRKIYVSTSATASGQPAANRVEELTLNAQGVVPTNGQGVPLESNRRTVLKYFNNTGDNNHTVNWIGFDPTATGAARGHLYVSTGDGGPQINQSTFVNKAQDLTQVYGKILRIDPTGPDAYADNPPDKNFAIPTDNPIPAWNAANPAAPISGLGEVWASGLRNTWRASFDRATGDLWMGDVGSVVNAPTGPTGFISQEEVNVLKAGVTDAGLPVDFGWAKREGTYQVPFAAGGAKGDSVDPVHQQSHATNRSVTGGYVYRGPIEELQGQYLFADFALRQVYALSGFDRTLDPTAYNGANATQANLTASLANLVFDASDPTYTAANSGSLFGLDYLSSFGEDLQGNVYMVDFGHAGQYPGAGQGEVFRLVMLGDIDRDGDRDPTDVDLAYAAPVGTVAQVGKLVDLNRDGVVVPGFYVVSSDVAHLVRQLLDTEFGDADLDGAVEFADLAVLAANYGNDDPALGWASGDFDGVGGATFADLALVAANYGFGTGTRPTYEQFLADWHLALASVPEPGAAAALAGGAVAALARRRRKNSARRV